MKISKQVKAALAAALVIGATTVAHAGSEAEVDDLMKALDAEIAQVKEKTKDEVKQEVVTSVVKSVKAAPNAEDAGTEAVVVAQEQPNVAEANPNVSSSFDVVDRVRKRTAEALNADKNEIGSFDHNKKRIVVIGEAEMAMDVKGDKTGAWAL